VHNDQGLGRHDAQFLFSCSRCPYSATLTREENLSALPLVASCNQKEFLLQLELEINSSSRPVLHQLLAHRL
jgi:hypothetical protein